MKVLIILAIVVILSAPYCLDNDITVGQIAKDVEETTGKVIGSIQEKTSNYSN